MQEIKISNEFILFLMYITITMKQILLYCDVYASLTHCKKENEECGHGTIHNL